MIGEHQKPKETHAPLAGLGSENSTSQAEDSGFCLIILELTLLGTPET